MKKLTLALMCAISVILLATSCKKKTDNTTPTTPTTQTPPTIEFVNAGPGYVYADTTVVLGTPVGIQVLATATNDNDLLAEFKVAVYVNGTFKRDTTFSINKQKTFVRDATPTPTDTVGVFVYEFTAVTVNKLSTTKVIKITVTEPEPIINLDGNILWVRQGGNPGEGLDMFGLKWTSNYKEVCAKIVAIDTDKVDFRRLDGVAFDEIDDIVTAFYEGVKIDEFHEISCEKPSATYDYVIATHVYKNDDTEVDLYYIMHVTNSTVTTDPTIGTTVSITGDYRGVAFK